MVNIFLWGNIHIQKMHKSSVDHSKNFDKCIYLCNSNFAQVIGHYYYTRKFLWDIAFEKFSFSFHKFTSCRATGYSLETVTLLSRIHRNEEKHNVERTQCCPSWGSLGLWPEVQSAHKRRTLICFTVISEHLQRCCHSTKNLCVNYKSAHHLGMCVALFTCLEEPRGPLCKWEKALLSQMEESSTRV